MKHFLATIRSRWTALLVGSLLMAMPASAFAAGTKTGSGSTGIKGIISSAAPTQAATITTPTNGQTFTTIPVTVAGLCKTGLLIKIFDNNVFMGSASCINGSYSLKIDLFDGQNDLVARVFDALDQAGPDSNVVRITFNDAQFNTTGAPLMTLTSDYANRGANPGATLTWPFILSGGVGPYAISADWGDGKASDLISQQFAGSFTLAHVYDSAGLYTVTLKATDKNGLTAYLQVVATANGAITTNANGSAASGAVTVIVNSRVPILILTAMLIANIFAFWLGQRYALARLRKRLEQGEYS